MNQIPKAYEAKFENGIQHPELYLWDAWSFVENKVMHLYCLAIPRYKSDGSKLDPSERNDFPFHIRHFTSSNDGLSWKDEGCFFNSIQYSKLNYRTIWSGCVKPMPNGKKLVAYTGIENADLDHKYIQNITLATSDDGHSVNTLVNKVLLSPSRDWKYITDKGFYLDVQDNLGSNQGEEGGPIMAWRDPFIYFDVKGKLNLFLAAKIRPRESALARITMNQREGLFELAELHPPIIVPDVEDFTQLEVPKILFDHDNETYYLIISTCNRLYENQPESEIEKEVRLYKSKNMNGPWVSLGENILNKENLFGLTVLKTDFKNNRLLCMAPYTEA
ncbi:MAG: hypothetical protein EX263_09050, partial [Flavobacteriaceae bacterium]